MKNFLPLTCLIAALAACGEEHAHDPGKQQLAAAKQAQEAFGHLDKSQSDVIEMAVRETDQIEDFKEKWLTTDLAKQKIQIEVAELDENGNYGKTLDEYRREQLLAAAEHFKTIADDPAGRPRQRMGALMSLAEVESSLARDKVERAGQKWSELTPKRTSIFNDANTIRLLATAEQARRNVDLQSKLQAAQSEQQELQTAHNELESTVNELSAEVDGLQSKIQQLSKKRDDAFAKAVKLEREAFPKLGQERFDLMNQAIEQRDIAQQAQNQINRERAQLGRAEARLGVDQLRLSQLADELAQVSEAIQKIEERVSQNTELANGERSEAQRLLERLTEAHQQVSQAHNGDVDSDAVNGLIDSAAAHYDQAIAHLEKAIEFAKAVDRQPMPQNQAKLFRDHKIQVRLENVATLQLNATKAELGHTRHRQAAINQTQANALSKSAEALAAAPTSADMAETLKQDAEAAATKAEETRELAKQVLQNTVTALDRLAAVPNLTVQKPSKGVLITVLEGLGRINDDENSLQKADRLRGELLDAQDN